MARDPFMKELENLDISDYVKNHYRKCLEQGGFCRRGIEFAIKVLTLRPRKK